MNRSIRSIISLYGPVPSEWQIWANAQARAAALYIRGIELEAVDHNDLDCVALRIDATYPGDCLAAARCSAKCGDVAADRWK